MHSENIPTHKTKIVGMVEFRLERIIYNPLMNSGTPRITAFSLAIPLLAALIVACGSGGSEDQPWQAPGQGSPTALAGGGGDTISMPTATQSWRLATPRLPGSPIQTPTPDNPHPLPLLRTQPESYTAKAGDTLRQIANRFGVSVELIAQANQITDPNLITVGQLLTIPPPTPGAPGPAFKIIPDSELVYSPSNLGFNAMEIAANVPGYLASYQEDIGGKTLTGAQIVQQIAQDYSVNPRLLLALLQHQSGWLTDPAPKRNQQEYPMGLIDPSFKGLFRQLSWAANALNRGYYLWRMNAVANWLLADGSIVPVAPTINAGTAGVQNFFSLLKDRPQWDAAVSEPGLFATYQAIFGYPFDYAIEPLVPSDLAQPAMQLPFEASIPWAYTGGPHAGWGEGSAWAALDFAPPIEAVGCVQSDEWVVAVADGLILRSENGMVIQDLDNDGLEQTGWVVLYLHIESRHRIQAGVYLQAGERIGHPSCEGGASTGTHIHLARRFNGEWIPADQNVPFVLDGWTSSGAGKEYDGYMQRGEILLEAYAGLSPTNMIQR